MTAFGYRKQNGAMGGLLFCAVLLTILGLGTFALDFSHVLAVRGELQNAADAAALAGAGAFAKLEEESAETHALDVANANTADGRAVSNNSPNTQVTAASYPSTGNGEPDVVEVDAQMTVNHMLAPIFGRRQDQISVTSRAGCYEQVKVLAANQAFPIAINPAAWPNGPNGNGKPVNDLNLGDPVVIVINPDGNPSRNAAWTSFNLGSANTTQYRDLLDQALGLVPPDPNYEIPQIEVGVDTIALDNGLNRGTDLDGYYADKIEAKPFLIFPLFTGNAYNQSRICIGFITVKINKITRSSSNFTLEGTLVKGIVKGWGGEVPLTGDADTDQTILNKSPAVVKLLSNQPS